VFQFSSEESSDEEEQQQMQMLRDRVRLKAEQEDLEEAKE
jgi:hypothetical protein